MVSLQLNVVIEWRLAVSRDSYAPNFCNFNFNLNEVWACEIEVGNLKFRLQEAACWTVIGRGDAGPTVKNYNGLPSFVSKHGSMQRFGASQRQSWPLLALFRQVEHSQARFINQNALTMRFQKSTDTRVNLGSREVCDAPTRGRASKDKRVE